MAVFVHTGVSARRFSLFTTQVSRAPHACQELTLYDLHDAIRRGTWRHLVEPVRELAPFKGEKDESGKRKSPRAQAHSDLKELSLPYTVLSGTWNPRHRHADGHRHRHRQQPCPVNGLLEPSGLRLVDIDHLDSAGRAYLMGTIRAGDLPWAAAAWVSTSGDGIHLVACLDPAPTCQAESHTAYAALIRDLSARVMGIEAANDTSSKNLMRPAFVSHDPDAILRQDAIPFRWQDPPVRENPHQSPGDGPEDAKGQDPFEPRRPHREAPAGGFGHHGGDADGHLVLLALEQMALHGAGEHDNHLLAVLGNMKSFGFSFQEFDAWAASAGCTCDRAPRWASPPAGSQSVKPGWAIVNLASRRYGFKKPNSGSGTRQTHRAGATTDDPCFSYRSAGLVGALRQAGYDVRYNVRAHRHEVKPITAQAQGELRPEAKPWPGGWLHLDEGAQAKILEVLATRAKHFGKASEPESYAPPSHTFEQAMKVLRNDLRVDPWQEWIDENVPAWDGQPRIDTIAQDVWLCADAEPDIDPRLLAQWGRCLINGLVARMLEPGCPVHTIPVLTGPEGRGKSLGMKLIFPEVWRHLLFTDNIDFRSLTDNKITIEQTAGALLVEIPEMSQLGARDLEAVKAAITRDTDRARLAYDKTTSDIRRTFSIVSTSNNLTPLPDDVTNRRFLPLRCPTHLHPQRVIEYFERKRLQLWAEGIATSTTEPLRHLVPYGLQQQQQDHNAGRTDDTDQPDAICDAIEAGPLTEGTMLELVHASGFYTRNTRNSGGDAESVELSLSEVSDKLSKSLQTRLGNQLRKRGWTGDRTGGTRHGGRVYRHPHMDEPGINDR